ncbi:GNAT family N-acetyltransferase [Roseivirga sp. UBA838]|uniref:GNAT family N-acetyltransferase n=1 Tax=Roseivirga sp. UBA838 TaxID=1947393 RepID=UPI002579FE0D|nr:GNAT family N-acetyltransferase [Roseivirga sp. UBA838]|tara:strand:+ start:11448 stop:11921 length:474 start_codon:yes stop_codon:yes gene_type:complete
MSIEFKRLSEVEKSEIIDLMNNSLVRRQMPLLKDDFNEILCDKFISAKEQLWTEYGYGPWAFVINNRFAGWGGLQPENGEADLALVLHPDYWGVGKVLYKGIINRAFGEMGLNSITILLPPTRTRINALLRLGFKKDGELEIDNEQFFKFRLVKPNS